MKQDQFNAIAVGNMIDNELRLQYDEIKVNQDIKEQFVEISAVIRINSRHYQQAVKKLT